MDEADRKAFQNLRARLALKGFALLDDSGHGFLIERWGLCRWCRDLAAVEAFAAGVGA